MESTIVPQSEAGMGSSRRDHLSVVLFSVLLMAILGARRCIAQQQITTTYTYDATSGLVTEEVVSQSSNSASLKLTQFQYASWHYSALADSNMLSELYETDKLMDNSTGNWKEHRTNWASFLINGQNVYMKSTESDLQPTGEFAPTSTFAYDDNGDVTSVTDANGGVTCYKYGYNDSRVFAKVAGAGTGDAGYTGLEDGWNDNWQAGGGGNNTPIVSTQSHTGTYSAYCSGSYGPSRNFPAGVLDLSKSYVLDAWAKVTSGTGMIAIQVMNSSGSQLLIVSSSITSSGGSGWQHVSVTITPQQLANLPSNGFLSVWCGFPNSSNAGYVDDVRFFPLGSEMTTYTFDPLTLLMTSRSDADNNPTYFLYDGLQRLVADRDGQANTLDTYSYYYSRSGNGDSYNSSQPNYIEHCLYRSATDSTNQKQFYDGLGREIQTVTGDGSNIIVNSTVEYDALDRIENVYKPFEKSGGTVLGYDASYSTDENTYYSGLTGPFYAQTIYNADPLNRVTQQSFPGNTWSVNSGHDLRYTYSPASANRYRVGTIDENGAIKDSYTDLLGNTVQAVQDSGGKNLSTSFTYDMIGDLTSSKDPTNKTTSYTYNVLGKVAQETSPDGGTTQYLYDENGNLRLIKDANHSGTANSFNANGLLIGTDSNQESFTLTMPGRVSISLQNSGDSSDNITGNIETTGGVVLISYQVTGSTGSGGTSIYLPKGTYQYVATSTSSDKDNEFSYDFYCSNDYEVIYRKYDPLDRLIEEGVLSGTTASGDFNQTNADSVNVPNQSHGYNTVFRRAFFYDTPSLDANAAGQTNILGRLSYSQVYDANGNVERTTSYSYDDRGRIDWIVIDGANWYPKKITYSYDFQGNLLERADIDQDWRVQPFDWNYQYDTVGRLNNIQTNAAGTVTQVGAYQYFASGNPQSLALGPGPVSTVTYHYNQRDWVDNLSSSQYYENVYYFGGPEFATPQYNGNISFVIYNFNGLYYYTDASIGLNSPASAVGYAYYYDTVNRLTQASFYPYSSGWRTSASYGVSGIKYDNDGNLLTLIRNQGNGAALDNLNYNYGTGDEVTSISNSVAGSSSSTYTYDSNGNVISDSKDNIAFSLYDIYNEPVAVYMTNGTVYTYAYDVSGTRIWKNSGGGPSYEFYANDPDGKTVAINLQPYSQDVDYNIWAGNDNIVQARYDNGSGYSYYYYLKDHLGNIKMVLNSSGAMDSYYNYYPFGEQMPGSSPQMNFAGSSDGRYKFTGKEQDPETGYDYFGARYYDSWRGQWLSVDPMTSVYPGWSPYAYGFDNPIRFVDIGGMGVDDAYSSIWIPAELAADIPQSARLDLDNENTFEDQSYTVGNQDGESEKGYSGDKAETSNEGGDPKKSSKEQKDKPKLYVLMSGGAKGYKRLAFKGGQLVQIEVTNINLLGTTIELETEFPKDFGFFSTVILPLETRVFQFTRFGSEPLTWVIDLSTESDAFIINYVVKSTWVPGMEPNPLLPPNLKETGK